MRFRKTLVTTALPALAIIAVWAGSLNSLQPALADTPQRSALADRFKSPFLQIGMSANQPAIESLEVDSLGYGKWLGNSLRTPPAPSAAFLAKRGDGENPWIEYRRASGGEASPFEWRFEFGPKEIRLISQLKSDGEAHPLVLEFDPHRCHATLLGRIDPDNSMQLPAILHLPDQGSLRITVRGDEKVRLGYDAKRSGQGYVRITFPGASAQRPRIEYRWEVGAIHPAIAGLENDRRFDGFRRNFLNILQINPRLRVLANHAGSDTCAFCQYEYADMAIHMPPLAEGLAATELVRQSLDRYLQGLAGYGLPGSVGFDIGDPTPSKDPPYLDSYPSLVIAAADYALASQDKAWLKKNYGGVKAWADRMLAMDRDGNGLLEYPYSGNSGSWTGDLYRRPSNWWDTIGFGHEDAYGNALAYRALGCMADMAKFGGHPDDAARYRQAAAKLRDAFCPAFYNPATGVLAGWRSADGQLHDYYFLWVNGIAIHYGLVPRDKANAIMDRLLAKMKEVGYTRFDLGLPGNLISVARKDYMHLQRRWGGGQREDNADGFQIYENGGATASFAFFTLAALYDLGRREEGDRILLPMLDAFEKAAFQGQRPDGMSNDWKAWDGTPWGYEGFLVDNYYALLAVLARQKALRYPGVELPSEPGR